jgi:acyl-CoA synthetase (AMP-forming)/AMP-acid ligase II
MQSLHQFPSTKLKKRCKSENVLYLLYTSGSTGQPKERKSPIETLLLLYSLLIEPGIKQKIRYLSSRHPFDVLVLNCFPYLQEQLL